MANKKILLGMLVLVLLFGMTVVGCGGGSIIGTWVSDENPRREISFSKGRDKGTGVYMYYDDGSPGPRFDYSIKGNTLTIIPMRGDYTYSVKGNKLTLVDRDNNSRTYTRK